jgi:hypothetical protein
MTPLARGADERSSNFRIILDKHEFGHRVTVTGAAPGMTTGKAMLRPP